MLYKTRNILSCFWAPFNSLVTLWRKILPLRPYQDNNHRLRPPHASLFTISSSRSVLRWTKVSNRARTYPRKSIESIRYPENGNFPKPSYHPSFRPSSTTVPLAAREPGRKEHASRRPTRPMEIRMLVSSCHAMQRTLPAGFARMAGQQFSIRFPRQITSTYFRRVKTVVCGH